MTPKAQVKLELMDEQGQRRKIKLLNNLKNQPKRQKCGDFNERYEPMSKWFFMSN